MNLFNYSFQQKSISFELHDQNVMVNATEMAKAFNKKVEPFMRNESTKNFIESCLKSENSSFLSVEKEEDLIISKQKSGTWMHRILALKFAAWLNPDFELWVYSTIDSILFDHYRRIEESLKDSAVRRVRLEELEKELLTDSKFVEYKELQLKERQASYRRGKNNSNQLDAFREMYKNQSN